MSTQVNNGDTYITRYAGPGKPGDQDRLRVELRVRNNGVGNPAADVSWAQFKDIVRLGQELIEQCEPSS